MYLDRCEVVLPGQCKGQFAVLDQGKAEPVGRVHAVNRFAAFGLFLHFLRQISDDDGTDIDEALPINALEIVFRIHALSLPDLDGLHDLFGHGPFQVDMQQSVRKRSARNVYAIGQQKGALELARGDASVEKHPVFVEFRLLSAYDKLAVFHSQRQILFRETGNSQGDPKRIFVCLFYIIRGVTIF
jgi:hypothetical protein